MDKERKKERRKGRERERKKGRKKERKRLMNELERVKRAKRELGRKE